MHYRRTRMSDVYRRVEHINSGCKKIDDRVFELCEVFKKLNLSDENQSKKNFCILCRQRTTPCNLTVSTPISISINPEEARKDYMTISQLNWSRQVGQGPSIPSKIHHNGERFTIVSKQQSDKKGMFTSGNVFAYLGILFFFFPSNSVCIIRWAMDKITRIYIDLS